MRKARWISWAPAPNKPTVSVGVKQHSTNRTQTELRGSVKVEVAVLGQGSPAEIKSREVELGSPRELDNPLLQLFLNSCFSNTVLVTLFRTAVETAVISDVHKLLRTGGVPTSLTVLFWQWLHGGLFGL